MLQAAKKIIPLGQPNISDIMEQVSFDQTKQI